MEAPRCSTMATAGLVLLMACLAPSVRGEVEPDQLTSGMGRFGSILCEDVDDDGRDEIVFGSYDGYVVSTEYRGGEYFVDWTSEQYGTRVWGLTCGQFDSDPAVEIIIGDGEGVVRSVDGRTKKLEWTSDTLVRDAHGLLLHDIDGDEKNELIVGTGFKTDQGWGTVYFFRQNSSEPYDQLDPFDSRLRHIEIADLDNDGDDELIVTSGAALGDVKGEGYFRIFDLSTKELEYKSPDLEGCMEGMAVVDLEGDGILEIVVSNGYRYRDGWCYIYHYIGGEYTRVWKSENIGPKAYGLDVGDVDADGVTEIVLSNMAGYVYIFDGTTFGLEWRSENLGRDVLGIVIGDPDGDGEMELIAGQGGYNGKGDFTSGYSTPHVYVIDGKTHSVEYVMGDVDEVVQWMKAVILGLVALAVLQAGLVARFWIMRKRNRKKQLERKMGGSV